MADRRAGPGPTPPLRPQRLGAGGKQTILQRLHDHMPNSAQVVGFLTLVISGGILLLLTGLTLTATVMGLIFFTPLILLTSPIWVPVAAVLFVAVAGFLSTCGVGVATLAGLSWVYKYFRGGRPPGAGRVDYARGRIADTAREYGGYLQGKVKDAAPGA